MQFCKRILGMTIGIISSSNEASFLIGFDNKSDRLFSVEDLKNHRAAFNYCSTFNIFKIYK